MNTLNKVITGGDCNDKHYKNKHGHPDHKTSVNKVSRKSSRNTNKSKRPKRRSGSRRTGSRRTSKSRRGSRRSSKSRRGSHDEHHY